MEIWQLLVKSNTVNFIIVLSCVLFICSKLNISDKLNSIKEEIKNFVDTSTNEKIDSENKLKQIKNKIDELPREIEEMQMTAKNNIEGIKNRIENEIVEKKQDIDNNVSRILNLETKKFKSKLTNALTEASINLAKDNAINQLKNNRELHNRYIYEAIEELNGIIL